VTFSPDLVEENSRARWISSWSATRASIRRFLRTSQGLASINAVSELAEDRSTQRACGPTERKTGLAGVVSVTLQP
jgi:hypothetical protein